MHNGPRRQQQTGPKKKPEGELGQTKTEQRKGKERAPAPDSGPRLWGRRGCRIDCWKEK